MLEKKSIIRVDTKEASQEASSTAIKGLCPECGYLDVFPLSPDTSLVQCKRCLKYFKVNADDSKRGEK